MKKSNLKHRKNRKYKKVRYKGKKQNTTKIKMGQKVTIHN